jgi:hypothetical protein
MSEKNEIVEVVSLLLEFEFQEFREIFTTLQKLSENEVAYKVIVAETRETGFPILELTGERENLERVLGELGYSKDMLVVDDPIESEDEISDEWQEDLEDVDSRLAEEEESDTE